MSQNLRINAKIDLAAIGRNMQHMADVIRPETKMAAVIKADGYGHGSCRIAQYLEEKGPENLWGFCVATFEEAHELRMKWIQKPILILGYTFPYCYEDLARMDIRPAVFRKDTLFQLNTAAQRVGKKMKIHIAVDTGMSRIGVTPDEEGLRFFELALGCEYLEIEGVFTHFSKADETEGVEFTRNQYERFVRFTDEVQEKLHYHIPIRHCANSAAIMTKPEYQLDMVRAGISMYGLLPSGEVSQDLVKIEPAMSLVSHIVYIKTLKAGSRVSYGGLFTADHDMRVATVPVGYADGYPRLLTGKAHVLIRGKKAPVIGRICMDQFMVDVDDIPEAREDDEVILMGRMGEEEITAEELGALSGRFNYELVCDISPRVPRTFTE